MNERTLNFLPPTTLPTSSFTYGFRCHQIQEAHGEQAGRQTDRVQTGSAGHTYTCSQNLTRRLQPCRMCIWCFLLYPPKPLDALLCAYASHAPARKVRGRRTCCDYRSPMHSHHGGARERSQRDSSEIAAASRGAMRATTHRVEPGAPHERRWQLEAAGAWLSIWEASGAQPAVCHHPSPLSVKRPPRYLGSTRGDTLTLAATWVEVAAAGWCQVAAVEWYQVAAVESCQVGGAGWYRVGAVE